MAKPNYAYAKRQRDIAKKQKKEEKKQLKADAQKQALEAKQLENEQTPQPQPPVDPT